MRDIAFLETLIFFVPNYILWRDICFWGQPISSGAKQFSINKLFIFVKNKKRHIFGLSKVN